MLNHRYMVGGVLGEGGFGITYIGLDTLLQFRVAIKEFYPAGMVNRNNSVSNDVQSISAASARELFSKSREHFLHEARTLAKFTNEPGIVAVRDFFEENHTVYIVMEYLDGITLKSYLKQVGTISSYNTICLLMPVFRSLKKIHEKNLIHRDISPDNIMLVGEQVKLLDFGAAREFADEKSLSVMLKHGYAPMEQYRRHGKQGAWTDIYAICATVYKCITGSIPPDAPDRIYEDNLKMPSELGFEASPEFEAVLRHGLAIKAEDRIQSIDQLLAELAAVPDFDIDFTDGAAPSERPMQTVAGTAGSDDGRLSQYIPRDSYDDESTVYQQTPPPSVSAPQPVQEQDDDRRLSEYIPSFNSKSEAPSELAQEQKPAAPAAPQENEKPKSKKKSPLPVIIAAAAVVAVAAGVGIFALAGRGTKKDDASSAAAKADSAADTKAIVSEAESEADTDPDSAAEPAESEADTSAPAESTADSDTDSTEEPHMHIIYPELGGNFAVEDGMLTMNSAVFSMKKTSIQLMFGAGTLYVTDQHDRWEQGQTVMLVPIDLGVYEEDYFDSIDLYFMDETLYNVQFENGGEYDESIRAKAVEKYGEPDYEEGQDIRWYLKDDDSIYRIYMQDYEGEQIFTQSYVYKDMAYKEGMVEEGFFD
ncbi:MAG: protein kinase [Ruminococcus sp.]|nr:protein kinase [Ruminococcus sp.]